MKILSFLAGLGTGLLLSRSAARRVQPCALWRGCHGGDVRGVEIPIASRERPRLAPRVGASPLRYNPIRHGRSGAAARHPHAPCTSCARVRSGCQNDNAAREARAQFVVAAAGDCCI